MQELLPKYKDELILVMGMSDVREVALNYGFENIITPNDIAYKFPQLVPNQRLDEQQTTNGMKTIY
jgi:hypothetical protein